MSDVNFYWVCGFAGMDRKSSGLPNAGRHGPIPSAVCSRTFCQRGNLGTYRYIDEDCSTFRLHKVDTIPNYLRTYVAT